MPNEEITISMYWIGTAEMYKGTAEIAVDEMKQSFQGNFFYTKKAIHYTLSETMEEMTVLKLKTPVQFPAQIQPSASGFAAVFEQMNTWYLNNYGCTFKFSYPSMSVDSSTWTPGLSCSLGLVSLPTKKLKLNGTTGIQVFSDPIILSSFWKRINLGRTNCIGGGAFETDCSI